MSTQTDAPHVVDEGKRKIAHCPDVWPEVEKILGLQDVPMEPIGMVVEFKLDSWVTATITFQLREDHVEQLAAIAARGLIVLQPVARPGVVYTCTRAEGCGPLAEYVFVGPDGRSEITMEQVLAPLQFKEGEKYALTLTPVPKG